MKTTSGIFNIIVLILLFSILIGCESNDNPQNSIYIPRPVNKKVLVEYFSNSNCQPCIAAHKYFIEPIENAAGQTINDTALIFLSWQFKYPNINDSIYWANPVQNAYRANFYSVLGAPYGALDGNYMGSFSSTDWTNEVNAEFKTTKYVNFNLSGSYDSISRNGSVTAAVQTLVAPPTSDNVIHFILAESKVMYISAPNGIKEYNDVMRSMITDTTGVSITLTQGATTTLTESYNINSKYVDFNCSIIIFIQSQSTKQIYGVEKIGVR
jgi:hypothetical protein